MGAIWLITPHQELALLGYSKSLVIICQEEPIAFFLKMALFYISLGDLKSPLSILELLNKFNKTTK